MFGCVKEFERGVGMSDIDLTVLQEAVSLAATKPELRQYAAQTIGCISVMMDDRQARWFGFDRLYLEALEVAVTRIVEEPVNLEVAIEVEEDTEGDA